MKYVALLRGINVGGRNLIPMAALKQCFERTGVENVATYIQSGNVLFESPERSAAKLGRLIEETVASTFGISARVLVLSHAQLETVLADVPAIWKREAPLRRNIAFLFPPVTASQALKEVSVNPDVDSAAAGPGVLYMSTTLSDLAQSRFPKLVGTRIYRDMTVRSHGTCQKILASLERAVPSAATLRKSGTPGTNLRRPRR